MGFPRTEEEREGEGVGEGPVQTGVHLSLCSRPPVSTRAPQPEERSRPRPQDPKSDAPVGVRENEETA